MSNFLYCCMLLQASLAQPSEEGLAQEAVKRLHTVDSFVSALSARLSGELIGSGGPLVATGDAVFVAAAFANEEAYWLALCLQV